VVWFSFWRNKIQTNENSWFGLVITIAFHKNLTDEEQVFLV